jgi:hypothetical protein
MNKIHWESWNAIEDEMCQKIKNKDDALSIEDMDGEESLEKQEFVFPPINPPYIITPFGNYDPDSPFRPAQRWECWMAYTNFRLSVDIVSLLVNIEGISAIKVMDRYCFCIGVSKMFKFKHVAADIARLLCSAKEEDLIENLPEDIESRVKTIRSEICDNKYWCIFVDSDYNIYQYTTESLSDFNVNVLSFEQIKKDNGGYLLKSKNEE